MKFSIVIPTRNRLEYLKTAINSVLIQDYKNFELVISDNASEEPIEEYISSLNDPRVLYSKTETLISVTENWNRALDQSSGDYIILIGDDDCLMNGSLSLLKNLISEHSPELIFSNALLYIYPGIVPQWEKGHLLSIGNWNLWGITSPSLVDQDLTRALSKEAMNFRLHFSYNMQFLTLKKSLIERLKIDGKFFHSPYPDYYAMTLLFYKAEKVLRCPYPTVVVGICPKSFGGYFFQNQEDVGINTLNIENEELNYKHLNKKTLPGKKINTYWLYALHSAKNTLEKFNEIDIKINYPRYRKIQTLEFLTNQAGKHKNFLHFLRFTRLFNFRELFTLAPILWFSWLLDSFFNTTKNVRFLQHLHRKFNQHPGHVNYTLTIDYESISDIIKKLTPYSTKSFFKTPS